MFNLAIFGFFLHLFSSSCVLFIPFFFISSFVYFHLPVPYFCSFTNSSLNLAFLCSFLSPLIVSLLFFLSFFHSLLLYYLSISSLCPSIQPSFFLLSIFSFFNTLLSFLSFLNLHPPLFILFASFLLPILSLSSTPTNPPILQFSPSFFPTLPCYFLPSLFLSNLKA